MSQTKLQKLIDSLRPESRLIFIIDGFGAALTFILLYAILNPHNEFFGLPKTTLTDLSLIALIFAIYSFSCAVFQPKKPNLFLKIIALANISYCFITAGLVIYHYQEITWAGILYFSGEISLVFGLALLELKIVSSNQKP